MTKRWFCGVLAVTYPNLRGHLGDNMRKGQRLLLFSIALGMFVLPACSRFDSGDRSGRRSAEPARILLLAGGRAHDFRTNSELLIEHLRQGDVEGSAEWQVQYTEDRDRLLAESLEEYDLVIVYVQLLRLTPGQAEGLAEFVEAGGGLVGMHSTGLSFGQNERFRELLGGFVDRLMPYGTVQVNVNQDHPVTSAIEEFQISDEIFLTQYQDSVEILMTAEAESPDEEAAVAWVKDYGDGRVFYTTLGHDKGAFEDPHFLRLVTNAVQWALGD